MRTTKHGDKRLRERSGIPRKAVSKQLARVVEFGKDRTTFGGPFRRYLDTLWRKGKDTERADKIIVYGNDIYLFANGALITTWPVPVKYRPRKHSMKMNEVDLILEAMGESFEDEYEEVQEGFPALDREEV